MHFTLNILWSDRIRVIVAKQFFLLLTCLFSYLLETFTKLKIKFLEYSHLKMNTNEKLVGIDWSLLSSPSYTYTHCFSLNDAKFSSKINALKMKKIYNSVSNSSRYMVQPLVLEVLMSSFERYPSWQNTIPRRYLLPGGSEASY